MNVTVYRISVKLFSSHFSVAHNRLVKRMSDTISEALSTRAPLQWRKKTLKPIEMKAPRYQQDYSLKKDIDPDKDRY